MPYRTIEVLKVGRYRLPDGRWFESTPERNRRVCEQANRQLSAGLRHPTAWMHDPAAEPVALSNGVRMHDEAWLAKGYFGEPVKFHFDDRTGNVLAKVLIHDEADARQFDKVGQVSPALYAGWVDERGVKWPEMTILHIAATPKPIQRDIARVTAYPPTFLSQSAGTSAAYLLSFPATPRSEPMADEKEEMEVTETDGGFNLTPDQIAKIVKMCAKHSLKLAGDIQDAKQLLIAMESASNTLTGEEGMDDEMDEMDEMDEVVDVSEDDGMADAPPPVMMSHLVKRVAEFEIKDRNARLTAALKSGKITKPHFEKLHKQLNAINLSQPAKKLFHKDGTFKRTEFDVVLDTIEQLPDGPLARKGQVNLGQTVVAVAHPDAAKTEEQKREERLKEIRNTPAVKNSKRK